jgi:formylglycine-generating enzyme required for sulfatase activity
VRKALLPLFTLLGVLLAALPAIAANGVLFVMCEPGVSIVVDGVTKGVTASESGGIVIRDIPEGVHTVTAEREGYLPQEYPSEVKAGDVVFLSILPFRSKPKISQEGELTEAGSRGRTGRLWIQSLPGEAAVTIDQLGLFREAKKRDFFKLDEVPEGRYQVVVQAGGKSLSQDVEIRGNQTSHLMFDLPEGKVVDKAAQPVAASAVAAAAPSAVAAPHPDPATLPEAAPAVAAAAPSTAPAPPPIAIPAPSPAPPKVLRDRGPELVAGRVPLEMVPVPGGSFEMGDAFGDGGSDEKPLHRVTLESFYIGKTEVTQRLWVAVMGSNPSHFQADELPVEQVSWDDCQQFISRLNGMTGRRYRLPTEAEWEYAARSGGKGEQYAGSDSPDPVAWYGANSADRTHPVGTRAANGLGVSDMSGNVWEWCSDRYGSGYYGVSPPDDPQGPTDGADRVGRGGGWSGGAGFTRCSFRCGLAPSFRDSSLGFRLAGDAE